jgi:hypothetical protein
MQLLKMEQWMSATPTIYNGVDISAIYKNLCTAAAATASIGNRQLQLATS